MGEEEGGHSEEKKEGTAEPIARTTLWHEQSSLWRPALRERGSLILRKAA